MANEPVTGNMKSLRVTDPQGNTYVLTLVDSAAREAASSASTLATSVGKTAVRYGNLADGADEYSPTSPYDVGDYCYRENVLYKCKTAISAPGETWDATHWDEVVITDLVGAAQSAAETAQSAASAASTLATTLDKNSVKYNNVVNDPDIAEYSPASPYDVGDHCYKDNELYRCNTAISAPGETWDATHWDKIIVNDLIGAAQTTADLAKDAIDEAKNIQFDDDYFSADEDDENVLIGLNGTPIGVDTDTPLVIESDTAEGLVLGADTLFTSSLTGDIQEFTDADPYAVGDLAVHKSKLYRCTSAVTAGSDWDATDWEEAPLIGFTRVDVEAVTGTVSSTTLSADLSPGAYRAITVGSTVTGIVLSIPDRSLSPTVLQRAWFEFSLAGDSVLSTLEVHSGGYSLPISGASGFTPGKTYRGEVMNGLVTLTEFDAPTALS